MADAARARSGTRRRPANNKQCVVAGQHKALRFTFTIQRSTDRSLRQDYSASVGAQAQALMARRGEGNKGVKGIELPDQIDRAQLIGKEALICS
ncbi:1-aminocyclopropane-1-carboxylate synthase-like protein 1 [Fusarium oxysporum f. sp. albedinis]|nr:1-aminocyclopropane-1-carboxylate synthase-like protein 1 [Fusarium oxysporum f. sp. albedinis]